mgnify:CR=1 FL=1|tara:strand:- start:878 stop:1504 length:627 start_codon:yes stop_codon:yes gene_type:complete
MDKNSSNVNKKTIKGLNKMYEQLNILECIRSEMRYFNYDGNDEIIDDNIYKMKELLDNMYGLSIQKKCRWTVFEPHNTEQPDTPPPNTPENRVRPSMTTPPGAPRKNIINEIIDYDSEGSDSDASDNTGSDMSIVSDENNDSVTDTSDDDYIDINDEEESSEEEYSYSGETNDEETPYRVHVTLPCEDTPDYTGTSDTSSVRNCPYCA